MVWIFTTNLLFYASDAISTFKLTEIEAAAVKHVTTVCATSEINLMAVDGNNL